MLDKWSIADPGFDYFLLLADNIPPFPGRQGLINTDSTRMGAWYSMTGYVSVVSPLINYGLGHIKGSLSPWRYM